MDCNKKKVKNSYEFNKDDFKDLNNIEVSVILLGVCTMKKKMGKIIYI